MTKKELEKFKKLLNDNTDLIFNGKRQPICSAQAIVNFISRIKANQRKDFIKLIQNTEEWEETYCEKDEQLLRAIKKEIINKIKKLK